MTLCPAGAEVLTVEYKVNFLAPAQGSEIVSTGRVVKAGRTLIVTHIDVEATDGAATTPCAVLQQTIMVVAPRARRGTDPFG